MENILRRKALMGKRGGRLPREYKEVEYLKSTGVQWINTGIIPTIDTSFRIVMTVNVTKYTAPVYYFFGERANLVNQAFLGVCGTSTRGMINVGLWAGQISVPVNEAGIEGILLDISSTRHIVSVNGKTIENERISDENTPKAIRVFRATGVNNFSPDVQINYIKIDEAIELIPCYRKTDNKPGMYDLVSGDFFVNQGTGDDFIVGPDV